MVTVDVIVDPENLPRIRLLQAHMRDLQVDLTLHEALPLEHSPRLIYVPRQKDSRLKQLPAPNAERIALYLDEGAEQIEAELAVQLYSWPARSSDPHVRTLARHLKKPVAATTSTTAHAAKQTSSASVSSERRKNAITLSAIGAVVLAVMLLMELDTPAPEQSSKPVQAAEQTIAGEGQVEPPTGRDSDAQQLTTTGQQIIESNNRIANEALITRPAAVSPRAKQTIAPCAGATELLRARLRWQLPTDLEPCAG